MTDLEFDDDRELRFDIERELESMMLDAAERARLRTIAQYGHQDVSVSPSGMRPASTVPAPGALRTAATTLAA